MDESKHVRSRLLELRLVRPPFFLEFFDDLITTSTFLNSRVAFIAELAPIIHIGNVAAACDVTDGPNDSQASRPPQQLLFLAVHLLCLALHTRRQPVLRLTFGL